MNESAWLLCEEADKMISFMCDQPAIVRRKAGRRKLRLFGCACCRRVWEEMSDLRTRAAVEVAERLADDEVSASEVSEAKVQAGEAMSKIFWSREESERKEVREGHQMAAQAGYTVLDRQAGNFACAGLGWGCGEGDPIGHKAYMERQRRQASLLRCIFGNPFRLSPPLPHSILAWNDRTIPRIAQGIYEERKMPDGTFDNSRLAILHDALLDAGCDNEELLTHLRSEGPHVRGCWPIDLILGKV